MTKKAMETSTNTIEIVDDTEEKLFLNDGVCYYHSVKGCSLVYKFNNDFYKVLHYKYLAPISHMYMYIYIYFDIYVANRIIYIYATDYTPQVL